MCQLYPPCLIFFFLRLFSENKSNSNVTAFAQIFFAASSTNFSVVLLYGSYQYYFLVISRLLIYCNSISISEMVNEKHAFLYIAVNSQINKAAKQGVKQKINKNSSEICFLKST